MQKNVSQVQGLYEYLLVVHPAKEVFEILQQEKEKFSTEYNTSVAKKTVPHITVANFLAKEAMEETMIRWMHRIISDQQSFDVALNNFSGFPPHTVYARVQDHQPFKRLASSLQVIDQYVRNSGCPPVHLSKHPHLTIARRLDADTYEKAMFDYARKTFHAIFTVNELILLKRGHQFDFCKQVNIFRLRAA